MMNVYGLVDIYHIYLIYTMLNLRIKLFNMLPKITNRDAEILDVSKDVPFISLILPFEPKMGLKTTLANMLNSAADKIAKELMGKYPKDEAIPVINKLHAVIKDMNYNIHKQSIAIFVSPLVEKVYYFKFDPADN
jgi:hypothetical protein